MSLTRISSKWALALQIPSLKSRAISWCSFRVTSPGFFYAPFLYWRLIRIFLFIRSGLLSPFRISFISEWAVLEIGGGDPGKSEQSTSAVEQNQWEAPWRKKEAKDHRARRSSCSEHNPTSRTTHCFIAGIGVDWVYPAARIREIETKN